MDTCSENPLWVRMLPIKGISKGIKVLKLRCICSSWSILIHPKIGSIWEKSTKACICELGDLFKDLWYSYMKLFWTLQSPALSPHCYLSTRWELSLLLKLRLFIWNSIQTEGFKFTRRRLSTAAARAKKALKHEAHEKVTHVHSRHSPYPKSNQQRYPVPDFLVDWLVCNWLCDN